MTLPRRNIRVETPKTKSRVKSSRTLRFLRQLKCAAGQWLDDDAFRLSAALSYYTVFSLGPLLILSVAISGFLVGRDAAAGELTSQLQVLVGVDGAQAVQSILSTVAHPGSNIIASVVGVIMLLIGASGVFAELNADLNLIWRTDPKVLSGWRGFLQARLLSFAMVLSVGFLLLVSLVVSASIAYVEKFIFARWSSSQQLMSWSSGVLSFALITFLFALMFKIMPNRSVKWRDVWLGATITSLLFTLGKSLIGIYLGKVILASAYGASASVVVILVWAYYSALIFYFGAEFTEVVSRPDNSTRAEFRKEAA